MSDVRDPERDQQLPEKTGGEYIQNLVMEDLKERLEHGVRKYGTGLQAHNGRDMMQDLYEELLDACVYVRGVIEERKTPKPATLRSGWDDPNKAAALGARWY